MTLNVKAAPFEPKLSFQQEKLIMEQLENEIFDKLEEQFIKENKYIFEPQDDPTEKYNTLIPQSP